MYSLANLIEIY